MSQYPNEGAGLFQYLKDLFSGDKYEDATDDSAWQEQTRRRRQEDKNKDKDVENKRKGG